MRAFLPMIVMSLFFVILKLLSVITLSWWVVLSPIYVPLGFAGLIIFGVAFYLLVYNLTLDIVNFMERIIRGKERD